MSALAIAARPTPPRPAPVQRGVSARLERALERSAGALGLVAVIEEHRIRPWSSATFEGAAHELVVASPRDPRLGEWVSGLPHAELFVAGHLVAALGVERIEDDGITLRVALSVLLLRD